jgi:hypothetical protein
MSLRKKKNAPDLVRDKWIRSDQREAKFGDTFRPLLLLGVATLCHYCNLVISNNFILEGAKCPNCKRRIKK